MSYFDTWRSNLKTYLAEFAPLAKEDRSLNLIYGITAAAVLWGVRDAPLNDEQRAALTKAVGDEKHLPYLLRAVGGWDAMTPLEATRTLSKRQRESDELRDALTALMGTFIEELFEQNMVQHQDIDISGTVIGENIVIGGYQIVAGDMVIQHVTRQKIRVCPSAPNPPKHFTGRETEIRQLLEQLTGHEVIAITAIQSMGGMGKTTLAQVLSHLPDKPFPTVLWAEITQNPKPRTHLETWARYSLEDYQLPQGGDVTLEQIADYVRAQLTNLINEMCEKPVLVVFDDVWENGYETVELLRRAAPDDSQILITTRHDNVVQRFNARAIGLHELSDDDAEGMLKKLRTNRHVTDQHLKRAVSLVKGHPLALEVAIASLNQAEDTTDVENILVDYERGIHDGTPFDAMQMDAQTPRSLNVVFARSYKELSLELQRYFRALGVLAPDSAWDRLLAGAVWGVEEQRKVTNIHRELRTAAFIDQNEKYNELYNGTWYRQHLLMRSYARALLDESREFETTLYRYTEHIIVQTEKFRSLSLENWEQLDPLLPHVHYTGDVLTEQYTTMQTREYAQYMSDFARNVARYVYERPQFINRSYDLRGHNWLEAGLKASQEQGDHNIEAILLRDVGRAYLVQQGSGGPNKAIDFFENSASLFQQLKDLHNAAISLTYAGEALQAASSWLTDGLLYDALDYYNGALLLHRRVGNKKMEATTLKNMGRYYYKFKRPQEALHYYNQALTLFQQVGYRPGEAATLMGKGQSLSDLGDQQQAQTSYNEAMQIYRLIGDRFNEFILLHNVAVSYFREGNLDEAINYVKQSIALAAKLGDHRVHPYTLDLSNWWREREKLDQYSQALLKHQETNNKTMEVTILDNIAGLYANLGARRQALDYYKMLLSVIQQLDHKPNEASTLINIGNVYAHKGENGKAVTYYEQALSIFRDLGNRNMEAYMLYYIGNMYTSLREYGKSVTCYEQALPIYRKLGKRQDEANTLYQIGNTHLDLGDREKALSYFEQALPIFRKLGIRRDEAHTSYQIGNTHFDLGDKEKALSYFEQALPIFQEIEKRLQRHNLASTLYKIGDSHLDLGNKEKAMTYYEQAWQIFQKIGERKLQADTLQKIGAMYGDLGDKEKALAYFEQALSIFRGMIDRDRETAEIEQNISKLQSKD